MTTRVLFLTIVMLSNWLGVLAQALRIEPPSTAAQGPPSLPESAPISVQREVSYGTAGRHRPLLDIYQPGEHSPDLRPAVVLIHGGGRTSFDKGTMRSMGMFLARCCFVALAVDYRLFHQNENLWPAQLDDVQRAVRWVRANAAKCRVEPDPIGAFGHSAGAPAGGSAGNGSDSRQFRRSPGQVFQHRAGGG
jgi:acetyl esterase/lipase